MHPSDADLVRRAVHGDDAACHELVDRHASYLYRLAFRMVGSSADAEDVLQETFMAAFQGLRSFAGRSAVKTWLAGILVRQAARCHRRRGRQKVVSLNDISEASRAALDSRDAAAASARESDSRMDVLAVLETLSSIDREVIVLREFEGMSYEEIAGVLGVPRGTVESRLFRARQELKERLKGYLP